MSNTIPTAEQLKPLYTAAVAYGRASVRASAVYRTSGHKGTPAVRRAGRVSDQCYRTMTTAREALNAQFPNLNLACPAPHVGFTGELDSYQQYVEKRLPDYIKERWAKRHRAKIEQLRKVLREVPMTDAYAAGEIVFDSDLYRVTRVTPAHRKILAVSLTTGKENQLRGPLKRIDSSLAERLLALYRSRQRALKAAGLATENESQGAESCSTPS